MFECASQENQTLARKALAVDLFSPSYLQMLKKEMQSKNKPSKAILQAVKHTNELNEKLRKENEALKDQLAEAKEENRMLIEMVDSYREQRTMQEGISESKLEDAYDKEAKMAGTILDLTKELEHTSQELALYRRLVTKRRDTFGAFQEPDSATFQIQDDELKRFMEDEKDTQKGELEGYLSKVAGCQTKSSMLNQASKSTGNEKETLLERSLGIFVEDGSSSDMAC